MATPEEQKKRIKEISGELNQLFARLDQADRTILRGTINELQKGQDNLNEWERALNRFKTTADKVADSLDYISKSFTDAVNELQKQDKFLVKGKSAMNSIANTAQKALSVRKGETDINAKNLKTKLKEADLQKDILNDAILMGRGTIAQNVAMNKALSDIDEYKKGLGEVLEVDRGIENSIGATAGILKGVEKTLGKFGLPAIGIEEAFNETKRLGQAAKHAGKDFNAFGTFTSNLKDNLKESLSTTKLIELAVLAVVKSMMFIDKTSGSIAKQLGIANSEARGLVSEFNSLSSSTMSVFVNTTNLAEAFGTLTSQIGLAKFASDEILTNQIELTKQAGYTNDAAAELTKLGAIQGTDSKEVLSNFLGNVEALNIQNGLQINSKALAESALKTSKATLLSLQGQGKSLGAAAFEAKKLGLELSQIEGIADSLLNIESSIAAEFEAEVITGKQLNLERARYYALTNNVEGLSKEIAKNVGSTAEFSKMNRIEQESLAKAVGLSRDSLGEMLYQQEALNKLSGVAGDTAQEKFNNLVKEVGLEKARAKMGDAQLAGQLQSVNVQERLLNIGLKLQTLFLKIAEPIMAIVEPFAKVLGFAAGLIAKLAPLLKIVTQVALVAKGIQLTFTLIAGAVNLMTNGFGRATKLLSGMRAVTKSILNTEKISLAYSKMREAFAKRGIAFQISANAKKKIAIILEKVGLINGKQLAYWKGRETFLSNTLNKNKATTQMYEKASLLSSIRRNVADKVGVATARVRSATEKGTLGTYIAQGVAKVFNNLKDRIALGIGVARGVAETTILGSMIAQGAAALVQIARQGILLGVTAAKAVAEFAAATAATLGIGTGPLIALAAVAAATVGGIIFALADDAKFEPKAPGYGKRELHDEGKITLFNDKDTIVAGTDLDKRSKNPRSSQPSTQFNQSLDYEKLAMTLGGVINNKQVTLSYSDFAQKTRPVFS